MNVAAQLLVLTDKIMNYRSTTALFLLAVIPHYFYCYRGVTVNFLPSPRYYREIFPIYRGITAVTAELPLSLVTASLSSAYLFNDIYCIMQLLSLQHCMQYRQQDRQVLVAVSERNDYCNSLSGHAMPR